MMELKRQEPTACQCVVVEQSWWFQLPPSGLHHCTYLGGQVVTGKLDLEESYSDQLGSHGSEGKLLLGEVVP